MSSPLLADAAVEWVAPQSDITNPGNPICCLRSVVRVSRFSHAYTLLMRLYEHMTDPAPPCWMAASYCGRDSSCRGRSSPSDESLLRAVSCPLGVLCLLVAITGFASLPPLASPPAL